MSKSISLFSGYAQVENRTTNYCLLLLKMLYEENPKFLAEVMGELVDEDLSERIGVNFDQQIRKGSSVPDGLICQSAFTIYIETKNQDWFYDKQLEKHLRALNEESHGLKVLLVLSNFERSDDERFGRIRHLCADQYRNEIKFQEVSFKDFVDALGDLQLPKNLADAVTEFRTYLAEKNLLPSWERRLDVINCAGLPNDVLVENVYICPASGGAYSHCRCKYFGMYRNRRIEKVALIEAVVDVEGPGVATIKWQNVTRSKDQVKNIAEAKVRKIRPDAFPARVFLLGKLYDTDCKKDSKYGMWGNKKYFDIEHLNADGAEELASLLKGKKWSEFD